MELPEMGCEDSSKAGAQMGASLIFNKASQAVDRE
jgi:hypothetical protein